MEPALCRSTSDGPTIYGLVCGPVYVLRGCQCNAVNALVNRHLVASGAQKPDAVREWLATYLKGLRPIVDSPELTAEWLARFTPARQKQIVASRKSPLCRPNLVSLMVKREITRACKKARGIQGYKDLRVQELTGPSIYALSRQLKERGPVRVGSNVVHYCPGYTGAAIVQATAPTPGDYYLECDGKNWDASVTVDTRHAVIDAIEPYLPASAVKALRAGVVARGTSNAGKGFIRYVAAGTVKSGHNDTTLGNTLLNLAINGCVMENSRILCAGDDSLVVGPRDALTAGADRLRSYGVVPEGGLFRHRDHTTFLGGRFYGNNFCPKIGAQLAKFYASAALVPPRLRAAFASRMRASVPHYLRVPVLRAHVSGPLGAPLPMRPDPRDGVPTIEDVAAAYGLRHQDILDAEAWILSRGSVPEIVRDLPYPVRVMVESDDLAPPERPQCLYSVR